MERYTVVGAFVAAAGAVGDMLDDVEDWSAPALGEWDIAGLAGHVIRIASATARYAALPQDPTLPLVDGAGGYYRSYMAQRASGAAESVADRGREEVGDLSTVSARFRAGVDASIAAIAGVGTDTILDTRYGALPLGEYLRTRILELTVHGLDLAHAMGREYAPPLAALEITLGLLGEIALGDRSAAVQLVLVLTGRSWGDPGTAFPVLT